MRQPRFLQVIASCVTLLLVVMPMTDLAQTQVKPGFNLFSPQQDIEIGKQSALEAEKQLQLIRDGRLLNISIASASGSPSKRQASVILTRSSSSTRRRSTPLRYRAGRSM